MFWFLLIAGLVLSLRQGSLRNKSNTYVPNPEGHWVNKGTEYEELWEWWEPESSKIPYYVSILDDEGKYIIVIDELPPNQIIEHVDCFGRREVEIAVSLYYAYYTVLGNVTIANHVGIELNNEINGGVI
jgi:hypothetical protein